MCQGPLYPTPNIPYLRTNPIIWRTGLGSHLVSDYQPPIVTDDWSRSIIFFSLSLPFLLLPLSDGQWRNQVKQSKASSYVESWVNREGHQQKENIGAQRRENMHVGDSEDCSEYMLPGTFKGLLFTLHTKPMKVLSHSHLVKPKLRVSESGLTCAL
jgi:hypothetical protein